MMRFAAINQTLIEKLNKDLLHFVGMVVHREDVYAQSLELPSARSWSVIRRSSSSTARRAPKLRCPKS